MTQLPEDSTAVYLCSHVFNHEAPILYVYKEDGEWQFLCGGEHGAKEKPHVVGFKHVLDRDPTISQLADLPEGWEAEREDVEAFWVRRAIDD